jgi:tetratricopeptide (TPR) repeat protein
VRADLGQYERAIQSYNEAIRLDPEYATTYYNRGNAFKALGNSIKAEQDLAKAKELGVY